MRATRIQHEHHQMEQPNVSPSRAMIVGPYTTLHAVYLHRGDSFCSARFLVVARFGCLEQRIFAHLPAAMVEWDTVISISQHVDSSGVAAAVFQYTIGLRRA